MEWYLNLDNLNALNEWEGVDATDAVLVNVVKKYMNPATAPRLKRTGGGYVWLDHKYLTGQLPILRLSKRGIGDRLRRLVECGLIERQLVYPRSRKGTIHKHCYYRVSEQYVEMCGYYSAVQAVHSDKALSDAERRIKLCDLDAEKPTVALRRRPARNVRKGHRSTSGRTMVNTIKSAEVELKGSEPAGAELSTAPTEVHTDVTTEVRAHVPDPISKFYPISRILSITAHAVTPGPGVRPAPTPGAATVVCRSCGKDLRRERNGLLDACAGCGRLIPEVRRFKESLKKETG